MWEKDAALIIQKYARRYIVRRKCKKQILKIKKARQDVIDRKAAIKIQKVARTYIVKQRIKAKHRAAFKIQGFMKMKWLSALFQDLRKNVLIIQVNNSIIFIHHIFIINKHNSHHRKQRKSGC